MANSPFNFSLLSWLILAGLTHATIAEARDRIIIGHRGASGYLPEHTLPSSALAHGFGVDYIEPDVVLSKDNIPIVLHDLHLEETTNVEDVFPTRKRQDGRFYAIDFTLTDLKQLKVHERIKQKDGKPYYPGRFPVQSQLFSIPTLAELIELVQGMNKSRSLQTGLYIEIKDPGFHHGEGKDLAKIILNTLEKYGYLNRPKEIYLQCFDPGELIRVKEKFAPPYPLVQLIGENEWGSSPTDYTKMQTDAGLAEVAKYASAIGPWINQLLKRQKQKWVSTGLLERAHRLKLKVHTYTLRADSLPKGLSFSQLAEQLWQLGVDGIFTDFGDQLMAIERPKG